MSDESVDVEDGAANGWEAVGKCLNQRDMAGAKAALEVICRESPDLAEGWINLGSVERALDDLPSAAAHLEKGVALLSARDATPDPLLLPAWLSLGEIYEILEDIPLAEKALRSAFKRAPEMASAMIQLAGLKARSGDLVGAKKAAKEYCMAAVSILSEKASIGLVRKFQKTLDAADTVDGRLLLVATREAYAMAFDRALNSDGSSMKPEAVVSTKADEVFALKRVDALVESTGEARELVRSPVYGFPGNAAAAKEALFTVPAALDSDFPSFVCTRTAWNDMHVRIKFKDAKGDDVLKLSVPVMEAWFRRGFAGEFSDGQGHGFFHSMGRPVPIADDGVRFDVDMGLSFQKALDALVADLNELNRTAPLAKVVFGDGLL